MSLRYLLVLLFFALPIGAADSDKKNRFDAFDPWAMEPLPGRDKDKAKSKQNEKRKPSSWSSSFSSQKDKKKSNDWGSSWSSSSKRDKDKGKDASSVFASKEKVKSDLWSQFSKAQKPKKPKSIWERDGKNEDKDDLRDDIDEIKNIVKKMPKFEDLRREMKEALGTRTENKKEVDEKVKFHWEMATENGWKLGLDLGLNTDLDFNGLITGIDDGTNLKLGGKLGFNVTYLRGQHEWRNNINIQEAFSRSPANDDWIKSTDIFSFETGYYWSPGKWWGVYAQLDIDTSVFPGYDIEENPATYHIEDPYGVPIRTVENATSLRLDEWFAPFNMDEFAGMYIRPFKIPEVTWELKLAAFSHQSYADGQLKYISRSGQNIRIRELSSAAQFGVNFGMDLIGLLAFMATSYKMSIDVGYAFFNTDIVTIEDNSRFVNGLNLKFTSAILVKPFSWVGIVWDFRVLRRPNETGDFQLESNIYLDVPMEF